MSFEWPLALLVPLLVVPLAVAGWIVLDRRRSREAARFASLALFPTVVARAPRRLRWVPALILLIGLAALLTGLARPHATISVPREEATVMLGLDVSRSMTADDIQPTRLAAARFAANRFVDQVPERFRVGVVTFATRAFVATQPTEDRDLVRSGMSSARPGEGTALGEAVTLAIRAARRVPGEREGEEPPPASILLISDGAQTQGDITPQQAAQRARQAKIPVYTIVLGTPDGVVERQLTGGFTERIRVPPDPEALKQLAETSGGEFFQVADEEALAKVYEELGSRLGSREKEAEVTVAFAGAGMALFLVAGALSAFGLRRLP
jgi:Ca-activated chloride channel family protein